ncbi:quercetin 2,3-dioxygenase [Betaproteobacteria bacterium GR16-43]|nr:quercetin 2,3-dioxygenase [Betaproteobacteria bacterium GR16-43]
MNPKKVLGVHAASPPHWVGDGFPVRSVFSYDGLGQKLSPFLLLDYAAPANFPPGTRPRGVGQHPHRGFETVTIVYQGEVDHRDSTGAGGHIGPGDVQWMTAASGLIHEEFHSQAFTKSGGTMEMAQLWVNLPARDKMTKPGYQAIVAKDIPSVDLPGGAGRVRVIAGEYAGNRGPAHTHTPMNVWDVRLGKDAKAELELPEGHTLAIVVLRGTLLVNGEVVRESHLAMLDRSGTTLTLEAISDATFLLLGGEPIDEPIVGYGPFVMNSTAEIQQAIDDFNNGRFGKMDLGHVAVT